LEELRAGADHKAATRTSPLIRMLDATPTSGGAVSEQEPYLMRRALATAAAGMPVFPLRPGTKVPALGRGWQHRATRDPERIRWWWHRSPFNIGVLTGRGLLVVDLDAPKVRHQPHGRLTLLVLARELDVHVPRGTRTVLTAGGGQHLYFRLPAGVVLPNTAGALGVHVDTRADGGYVVGPGSVVMGRRYRLLGEAPVAPVPVWLLDRLRPRARPGTTVPRDVSSAYVQAAVKGEVELVASAAVGTRNRTLFRAAARLGRFVVLGHLSVSDIESVLGDACRDHVDFGPREVQRTIGSGLRAAEHQPGADRPSAVGGTSSARRPAGPALGF
jgi:Bifunctional DNA primase/polymerase, N-terminal